MKKYIFEDRVQLSAVGHHLGFKHDSFSVLSFCIKSSAMIYRCKVMTPAFREAVDNYLTEATKHIHCGNIKYNRVLRSLSELKTYWNSKLSEDDFEEFKSSIPVELHYPEYEYQEFTAQGSPSSPVIIWQGKHKGFNTDIRNVMYIISYEVLDKAA